MRVELGMAGRQHWWVDEGHSMHRRIAWAPAVNRHSIGYASCRVKTHFFSLFSFPFLAKEHSGDLQCKLLYRVPHLLCTVLFLL